ncbi:MAG: MFS transporter [Dechloromonas sp.]|nr:MFS transporter [Dechloromonas sp.]
MARVPVFSYGVLGLPLAFAALPLYVHVPPLYAEVAGLSLVSLGAILLAARLFDAAIDPWLGWLADRWPRRPLLAAALLPFAAGFVALLNPPTENGAVWLLGALVLTYIGFSAATVAYQAWGADLGRDAVDRTRLTAAREGFALLGVLLAAALPAVLAASPTAGIRRLSWLLPPLLLLAALVSLGRVGPGSPPSRPAAPLGASLRRVVADVAFRRLLLIFVANGIASALPATLFLFFVADVLQVPAASGALLALYFLAGAASLPLWLSLARRHGRPFAWLLSMMLAMLSFAGAGLLGAGDLWLFALICLTSGLALGADLSLPAALAADMGDRLGQAGGCFGVWNFVAKLNLALAAGLALPLLGVLGYVPGSGQGLPALSLAYAVLPLLGKALAVALLWRWRHLLESSS